VTNPIGSDSHTIDVIPGNITDELQTFSILWLVYSIKGCLEFAICLFSITLYMFLLQGKFAALLFLMLDMSCNFVLFETC